MFINLIHINNMLIFKRKTMDPIKRNKWLNDEWNTKLEYLKFFVGIIKI